MSRYLPRLFALPATAVFALLLAAAVPASAQQPQVPRGNENGGEGGAGGRGGGGAGGNGGGGGGNGAAGAATGSGMSTADQIFADGVQREGAPVERAIGGGPGSAGGAGAGRGMGGFGGMGGMGGLGGFGGMSPFGGGQFGGQGQQTRTVRTRLSSAVDVAPLPPRAVGAAVGNRLATRYGNPRFSSVNIRMEGRTAILTGQVASEADLRMAQLLVRLEPGVSHIDSRLEVAPQP